MTASLLAISMGGYGALKMAFARPEQFVAVAALSPMVEPTLIASEMPLRNRYHYPAELPTHLVGAERDEDLFTADPPVWRAFQNRACDCRTVVAQIGRRVHWDGQCNGRRVFQTAPRSGVQWCRGGFWLA